MSEWPVKLAREAYIEGRIDLQTLEVAISDRLQGTSFKHDSRIDGHIPHDCRGDEYTPHGYGDIDA